MRRVERVAAGLAVIISGSFCTGAYAGIFGSTMNQTWYYGSTAAPESSNDGDRVLGVDFEDSAVPGTTWQTGLGFYTLVSDSAIEFRTNIDGHFVDPINLFVWSDVGDTLPNITNVHLENTSTWNSNASALPVLSFTSNSITIDCAGIYLYDSVGEFGSNSSGELVWKSIEIAITLEGNAVPGLPAMALFPPAILILNRRRR